MSEEFSFIYLEKTAHFLSKVTPPIFDFSLHLLLFVVLPRFTVSFGQLLFTMFLFQLVFG